MPIPYYYCFADFEINFQVDAMGSPATTQTGLKCVILNLRRHLIAKNTFVPKKAPSFKDFILQMHRELSRTRKALRRAPLWIIPVRLYRAQLQFMFLLVVVVAFFFVDSHHPFIFVHRSKWLLRSASSSTFCNNNKRKIPLSSSRPPSL